MKKERKKGGALLAGFMVLMMIINLLSGFSANVASAEETGPVPGTTAEGNQPENGGEIKGKLTINLEWVADPNKKPVYNYKIKASTGEEYTLGDYYNSTYSQELPVYASNGKLIEYTVKQELDQYYSDVTEYLQNNEIVTSVSSSPDNTGNETDSITFTFDKVEGQVQEKIITFTNTEFSKQSIKVRKVWEGTPAAKVKFELFSNSNEDQSEAGEGESFETIELTPSSKTPNNTLVWEGEFTKRRQNYSGAAPMYAPDKKIYYNVAELDESGHRIALGNEDKVKNTRSGMVNLEGRTYKVKKSNQDGVHVFTNTDISSGNFEITKTWIGTSAQTNVGLFRKSDNKKMDIQPTIEKEPAEENNYGPPKVKTTKSYIKFDSSNLPLVGTDGKPIEYVIREVDNAGNIISDGGTIEVDGKKYKVTYDAYGNITIAEYLNITVRKEWGSRVFEGMKVSATIGLFDNNNNNEIASVTLNDANSWKGEFKDIVSIAEGYRLKETKINGLTVDESFKELFESSGNLGVLESKEYVFKNDLKKVIKRCGSRVVKLWEENSKRDKITVAEYKKMNGNWVKGKVGTAEGTTTVEVIEAFKGCTMPGNPSPACAPGGNYLVITDELLERWMETHTTPPPACHNLDIDPDIDGLFKRGAITTPAINPSEYAILEIAIGEKKLSEEEILALLNSGNLDKLEYKLGAYNVAIQRDDKGFYLIKNSDGYETPSNPATPTTPVLPVNPGTSVVPSTPTTPVNPSPETPSVVVPENTTPEGKTGKDNNGGVEVIDDDDVPQDGREVDEEKSNTETQDIDDNGTPRGTKKLPITGGSTGALLSIAGLVLIGLAFVFRKRR